MVNLHCRTNEVTEYAYDHVAATRRSLAAATNPHIPHHKYFKASRHMQMSLKHFCNSVEMFYHSGLHNCDKTKILQKMCLILVVFR